MKRLVGFAIGLALLSGCASDGSSSAAGGDGAGSTRANSSEPLQAAAMPSASTGSGMSAPTASSSDVIARINGKQITMQQLKGPLLEAYGLNVLLNVVQLELAKNEAQRQGITIGPSDVEEERTLTTERMFKGSDADSKVQQAIDDAEMKKDTVLAESLKQKLRRDRDSMLVQFLEQQKVSRPEFELVLQTNAYLRKIAEPQLKGKITDDQLHAAFDAEYGASVVIRHIQGQPRDLEVAKARIEKGEKFEDVAKEVSTNRQTAALGGEMKKFTLASPFYPDHFKRLAFDLKDGEISGVVEAGGNFHILKLDKRIPPKAVKFEAVRDSLKERLYDAVMQAAVKEMRDQLATLARTNLKIDEPILRDQFQKKLEDRENTIRDQQKIREQMDKDRAQSQNKSGIPTVGAEPPADALKPEIPAPVPAPAGPAAPGAPAAPATPAPAAPAPAAPAPAVEEPKPAAPPAAKAPAPAPAAPGAPAAPAVPAAPTAPAGGPAPTK